MNHQDRAYHRHGTWDMIDLPHPPIAANRRPKYDPSFSSKTLPNGTRSRKPIEPKLSRRHPAITEVCSRFEPQPPIHHDHRPQKSAPRIVKRIDMSNIFGFVAPTESKRDLPISIGVEGDQAKESRTGKTVQTRSETVDFGHDQDERSRKQEPERLIADALPVDKGNTPQVDVDIVQTHDGINDQRDLQYPEAVPVPDGLTDIGASSSSHSIRDEILSIGVQDEMEFQSTATSPETTNTSTDVNKEYQQTNSDPVMTTAISIGSPDIDTAGIKRNTPMRTGRLSTTTASPIGVRTSIQDTIRALEARRQSQLNGEVIPDPVNSPVLTPRTMAREEPDFDKTLHEQVELAPEPVDSPVLTPKMMAKEAPDVERTRLGSIQASDAETPSIGRDDQPEFSSESSSDYQSSSARTSVPTPNGVSTAEAFSGDVMEPTVGDDNDVLNQALASSSFELSDASSDRVDRERPTIPDDGLANLSTSMVGNPRQADDQSIAIPEPRIDMFEFPLIKHGRGGKPRRVFITVDTSAGIIRWGDGRRYMKIEDISQVRSGKHTDVFRKKALRKLDARLCLSLITKERSFDMECKTSEERRTVMITLMEQIVGCLRGNGVRAAWIKPHLPAS